MRKTAVLFTVVMLCAVMSAAALVGCGGGAASSSAASTSSASASSSASKSSGVITTIDGVDVKDISFDMVGDTPNFMIIFSNTTDNDIEVDLSKFKIMVNDTDEVSFHLTTKTVAANTKHAQNAFTASANSMKVGDEVYVYYNGELVGTYEVQEF
ncbi:MAG: hypothetical protein IJ087_13855 [Eggerthellaceae bacterium]|nr:hypothetical protein [Eggerthellaceae bacterium]